MTIAALLALFFGGMAAGSLRTTQQTYKWRNATIVRGVLVKHGSRFHYEYRPKGLPIVASEAFQGASSGERDGVVNNSVRLEYDPQLPERLRQHLTKGRPESPQKYMMVTGITGAVFGVIALVCLWQFGRGWYELREQ